MVRDSRESCCSLSIISGRVLLISAALRYRLTIPHPYDAAYKASASPCLCLSCGNNAEYCGGRAYGYWAMCNHAPLLLEYLKLLTFLFKLTHLIYRNRVDFSLDGNRIELPDFNVALYLLIRCLAYQYSSGPGS